jgi:hypothetical protein
MILKNAALSLVAAAVVAVPVVATAAPAAAITVNGRTCVSTGSFGAWYPQKYYGNKYQGPGPKFWTKTGANGWCRDWVYGF